MTTSSPDTAVLGRLDSPDVQAAVAAEFDDKRARVSRLLERPVDLAVPSPRAARYRARLSLRTDRSGLLGFTRPGSHDFVAAGDAPLARSELLPVLQALPPLPGLGSVELRTDGEKVVLAAWSPRKGRGARNRRNRGASAEARARVGGLVETVPGLAGVALDGKAIAGDAVLHPRVQGVRLHVGPASFFQVNLDVNASLVAHVIEQAAAAEPERVVDLYAGVGNIGLPLARATGAGVVLVESHPQAAADARKAARAAGIDAEMRTADADRFQAGDAFFDVAVLDPPRAGARGVLSQLVVTRPRRIVYVSCNASALARDLREARAAGYTPCHVAVFDMFPQTPHVETVCVLER